MNPLIRTILTTAALGLASSVAAANEDNDTKSWLFAQTASEFISDGSTLTLPYERELFAFTDRPNRAHVYLNAHEFQSLWNVGEDNFTTNPPNAVLTWVADGDILEAEIELVSAQLRDSGRSITYQVRTEDGQMLPIRGHQVSLFIDSERGLENAFLTASQGF